MTVRCVYTYTVFVWRCTCNDRYSVLSCITEYYSCKQYSWNIDAHIMYMFWIFRDRSTICTNCGVISSFWPPLTCKKFQQWCGHSYMLFYYLFYFDKHLNLIANNNYCIASIAMMLRTTVTFRRTYIYHLIVNTFYYMYVTHLFPIVKASQVENYINVYKL